MQEKSLFIHFKEVITLNYANFDGRARRREFWGFTLFSTLFSLLASLIDNIIFDTALGQNGIINGIYSLAIFIPSIAVATRRLHDVGKSGWMQLLYFFIIIGWIWLLVLFVTDSNEETNEYGANPKNPNFGSELEDIGTE